MYFLVFMKNLVQKYFTNLPFCFVYPSQCFSLSFRVRTRASNAAFEHAQLPLFRLMVVLLSLKGFGLACFRVEKKEESTGAKLARRVSSLLKVSPFLRSSNFGPIFKLYGYFARWTKQNFLEKLLPLKKPEPLRCSPMYFGFRHEMRGCVIFCIFYYTFPRSSCDSTYMLFICKQVK